MSLDSDLLSKLSTSIYQLSLLDQGLDYLGEAKGQAEPSMLFPPQEGEAPYKSEIVIQVAIKNIQSFQAHIEKIPSTPTVRALAPKILKQALSVLEEIIKKAPDLPMATEKDSLIKDAVLCKKALEQKIQLFMQTKPSPIEEESPGKLDKILMALIPLIAPQLISLAGIKPEESPIKQKILQHQEALKILSPNKEAEKFAHSLSQFLVKYLNAHLAEVKKEEPSLRPKFIKYFFYNPHSSEPTPSALHTLVVPLLESHKELVGDIIELNLLKGLHQAYATLNNIQKQNPDFLVDFVRQSFHIAILNVKKEEEARKEQGINPLTVKERNLLLSGGFQKNLTQAILLLSLPGGAKNLELPEILSSIPGVEKAMDYVKTEYIWPLLQDGLQDLFHSIFKDLCFNDDVKTSLLIEGYSLALPLLAGETEEGAEKTGATTKGKKPSPKSKHLERLSMVSALSVGVVTAFFAIIIDAIKSLVGAAPNAEKTGYLHQTELNEDLTKMLDWFAQGSSSRKFVLKKFGQKIATSMGASLTKGLRNITVTHFLDEQLKNISSHALESSDEKDLFPKTEKEEEAAKNTQFTQRKEDIKRLEQLRNQVGNSLDGLISLLTEGIYPKGDESTMSKARVLLRSFLRASLFNLIRFVFWIARVKGHFVNMDERFYKATQMLQQDEILMASSSAAAEAILSPKPAVSHQIPQPKKP